MKPFRPIHCLVLLSTVATLGAQAIKLSPDRELRAKEATELRLHYAASKDYDPYNDEVAEIKQKCSSLMREKSFAAAIEEADRGLRLDKYNIELLIAKAAAYRAMGDTEKAEEVRQQWMLLMDSIMLSGDGRDFSTAFRVISIDEEYAVLKVMRIEKASQALLKHDGSSFDVFTVKDPDSDKEFQLYFNIDLPMKWLNAKYAPAGGSQQPNEAPPPSPPAVKQSQ